MGRPARRRAAAARRRRLRRGRPRRGALQLHARRRASSRPSTSDGTGNVIDACRPAGVDRLARDQHLRDLRPGAGSAGDGGRLAAGVGAGRPVQAHEARGGAARARGRRRSASTRRRRSARATRAPDADRRDDPRRRRRPLPRVPADRRRTSSTSAMSPAATRSRSSAAGPGERYLLGGADLPLSELFAAVARLAGRPRPRLAVPYAAIRAGAALGLVNRNEAILARTPAYFSSGEGRARARLPARAGRAGARASRSRSPQCFLSFRDSVPEPDHGEEDQPDDQHAGDDVTAFRGGVGEQREHGASLTHAPGVRPRAPVELVDGAARARARRARPARGLPTGLCRAAPPSPPRPRRRRARRPPGAGRRPRSARRARRRRRRSPCAAIADEPVRVEVVAEQQRGVPVARREEPRAARSGAGSPRRSSRVRARSARRASGEKTGSCSAVAGGAAPRPRAGSRPPPRRRSRSQTSTEEAATASTVLSISSSPCASETNIASNCDGAR